MSLIPVVACVLLFSTGCTTTTKMIRLENRSCCVEIEPVHGRVVRIHDKVGGLDLLSEPRLSENFRFTVPLPGHGSNIEATEGNYILGKDQTLTSSHQSAREVTLRWKGPLTNQQGDKYDMDVAMKIELEGAEVRFKLSIANRTPYRIGEVWYPMLGGMDGLGEPARRRAETQLAYPTASGIQLENIFQFFNGSSIYAFLGTPVPERFFAYPSFFPLIAINWASKSVCPQGWIEFTAPGTDRGVYVGVHDARTRFRVMTLQMYPAAAPAREGGDWPRPDEYPDQPVGVVLNWVHFPYAAPATQYDGPPVIVRFHEGGWQAASRIYCDWLRSVTPPPSADPNWLRQKSAIQEVYGIRFSELPHLARDARESGVKVLLLSGWQKGGDESGILNHEPEPRLGDWQTLKDSIEECHRLDVRVLLTYNVQPILAESDLYRNQLEPYACMGPWNNQYTPDRGKSVWLEPAFAPVRQMIVDQAKQLAESGADGLHIQRLLTAQLDFNRRLNIPPDQASWEGTLVLFDELTRACRAIRPDFAITVGDYWDRLRNRTDAVMPIPGGVALYQQVVPILQPASPPPAFATTKPSNPAQLKQLFPWWPPTVVISHGDQFDQVNEAIRCGGRLRMTSGLGHESMRELASYIKQVQGIRDALADRIYLGEFADGSDAQVDGTVTFSVWRDPHTVRRACVMVNSGSNAVEATFRGWTNRKTTAVRVYEPFKESSLKETPFRFILAPHRLLVVAEE